MCKSYTHVFVEKSSEKKIKQVFYEKDCFFLSKAIYFIKKTRNIKQEG